MRFSCRRHPKAYEFKGVRYDVDESDPMSYEGLVKAMLNDGCLAGELVGYVNEEYDLPHMLVEDMLDRGAQATLDRLLDGFVCFVAESFEPVAGRYVKEVEI